MAIGGLVSRLRLAPVENVLYVAPFGSSARVALREGCGYDEVKFPEGSLQLSGATEDTPAGAVHSTELTGQLSPVCAEHDALLDRYRMAPFICIAELKSGATMLIGDNIIGCTLQTGTEVSADYSTSCYSVTIACRSTHANRFLEKF
jgi:hypothetical protein